MKILRASGKKKVSIEEALDEVLSSREGPLLTHEQEVKTDLAAQQTAEALYRDSAIGYEELNKRVVCSS